MPANRASHIAIESGQSIWQPSAGGVHCLTAAIQNPLNPIDPHSSTGCEISFRCQKGKKLDDMRVAQRRGVLLAVEQDEELDPIQVGTDGPPTVAVSPHVFFNRVEKGGSSHGNTSSLKCQGGVIPFDHGDVEAEYLLIPKNSRSRSEKFFKVIALPFDRADWSAVNGIPSNNCYEIDQTSLTDC